MSLTFTPAVGMKFHEDGTVRRFPGNTFLCHVQYDSPVYQEVIWAQQQLKKMACAKNYAFLPERSMHMTVFEGVCDQVRESSHWSAHLPLDLPVEQVTATFIEALRAVEATVGFDMVIDQVYNSEVGGTLLRLKPANARTEQALHALREQLSALTGIRQPVHDSYHFHITLSYKLVHLSSAQEAELAAVCQVIEQRLRERFGVLRHSAVEFCEFDDMFQFTPRLMLPLVA